MSKVQERRHLTEYLSRLVEEHKKAGKDNVFSIESSNNKSTLCTILEIGEDFIEVKDNEGRIRAFSLSSGIGSIRDVTGVSGFEFKGGK